MTAPVHLIDFSATSHAVLLHSNEEGGRTLFACGCEQEIQLHAGMGSLDALRGLVSKGDWVFTTLGYDLKNEIESLYSLNPDSMGFPEVCAFIPEQVWEWSENHWVNLKGSGQPAYRSNTEEEITLWELRPRVSRTAYLQDVGELLRHIHRGDIYEINYCQEFFAEGVQASPAGLYQRLNEQTQAPFSALFHCPAGTLVSGSPERFLKKEGHRVVSQPIKGTTARGITPEEDAQRIQELRNDPKEISENIMITDLVRNDLSKVASRGSVTVDELCGIYSFRTVHQMISTVSCQVEEDVHPLDIVKACFPMGSMTGAPKIRAMELIETYEHRKRGWYSGAVGYFTPSGDFDLNVVIRSLLYNPHTGMLSASVGGAITARSVPELEYEECMLKLEALRLALTHVEEG